jgi:outer membrane protein assembly factor BamD (BamD/ComL family)
VTLTCPYCGLEISAETGLQMSGKVRNHTWEVHHRSDPQVMREAMDKLEKAAARYPYEQYLKDIGK